jgi:hypothetical protein
MTPKIQQHHCNKANAQAENPCSVGVKTPQYSRRMSPTKQFVSAAIPFPAELALGNTGRTELHSRHTVFLVAISKAHQFPVGKESRLLDFPCAPSWLDSQKGYYYKMPSNAAMGPAGWIQTWPRLWHFVIP